VAKVKADLRLPIVDIPKARKTIHEYMTQFTLDILADWVIGATNVIPVWSGASRATFLKLANQAAIDILIEPLIVAPIGSRIPLGFAESLGVVIADARGSGAIYGWDYVATLDYIGIVQDRVNFLEAGDAAIAGKKPQLPKPPTKPGAKDPK
jgi:hypothetical protein